MLSCDQQITLSISRLELTQEHRTMTKFLLPIAINVINKAVDKIPEDLDELLKKFVVSILKKAAAKSGNKVDDLLVAQLEKALFE